MEGSLCTFISKIKNNERVVKTALFLWKKQRERAGAEISEKHDTKIQ